MSRNMISGKILYSDFTHINANASRRKLEKKEIEVSVKEYFVDLEKAVEEDRTAHEKKPLKKR